MVERSADPAHPIEFRHSADPTIAAAEIAAMRRAITLAEHGLGSTSPNPVVGAVVLDRNARVAGEGFHLAAGAPHAEVAALDAAGERARGGTIVVTLEPCGHTGRTGPCTTAIVASGIRRVVYAVADPLHPGGAEQLRRAGVDVSGGVLAEPAALGNEAWLAAVRLGRPFVVWKYASSLDGRVAAADGSSRWVSGAAARADAHLLRSQLDSIMVGVGTVLADDPQLTARDASGGPAERQPLRVVVDTEGRTPADARVRDHAAPTLILTAAEVKRDGARGLDLEAVLALLYDQGVRSVLLEGGPTLAGSFVRAGLVDKVVGYLAPTLLGAGLPALSDAGICTVGEAARLRVHEVTRLGADVKLVCYPVREPADVHRDR